MLQIGLQRLSAIWDVLQMFAWNSNLGLEEHFIWLSSLAEHS
jgi:hypothetical protein